MANNNDDVIAVDAMGGDFAPEEIVKGVEKYRDENDKVSFLLFGDENLINQFIQNKKNIKIIHTEEIITMDDEPVKSIRTKKNSSLVKAAESVKNGEASSLFSAGNTGAILASSIFIIGRIKGVQRPALMTMIPDLINNKNSIMLDVGANADNKVEFLEQFAVLGDIYSKTILNIDNPVIKLLNNGTEYTKGDSLHKEAYKLLDGNDKINFQGNIESRELLNGEADVVVADGFSGNIALKAMEGSVLSTLSLVKKEILNSSAKAKLGAALLKPTLKNIISKLDYNEAGGAVILGVKSPVIKTHGSAKALEVSNSLKQLDLFFKNDLIKEIEKKLND